MKKDGKRKEREKKEKLFEKHLSGERERVSKSSKRAEEEGGGREREKKEGKGKRNGYLFPLKALSLLFSSFLLSYSRKLSV